MDEEEEVEKDDDHKEEATNLYTGLDVDGGDLLDDLGGGVQVDDALVDPHLELVPGLGALTWDKKGQNRCSMQGYGLGLWLDIFRNQGFNQESWDWL